MYSHFYKVGDKYLFHFHLFFCKGVKHCNIFKSFSFITFNNNVFKLQITLYIFTNKIETKFYTNTERTIKYCCQLSGITTSHTCALYRPQVSCDEI